MEKRPLNGCSSSSSSSDNQSVSHQTQPVLVSRLVVVVVEMEGVAVMAAVCCVQLDVNSLMVAQTVVKSRRKM